MSHWGTEVTGVQKALRPLSILNAIIFARFSGAKSDLVCSYMPVPVVAAVQGNA